MLMRTKLSWGSLSLPFVWNYFNAVLMHKIKKLIFFEVTVVTGKIFSSQRYILLFIFWILHCLLLKVAIPGRLLVEWSSDSSLLQNIEGYSTKLDRVTIEWPGKQVTGYSTGIRRTRLWFESWLESQSSARSWFESTQGRSKIKLDRSIVIRVDNRALENQTRSSDFTKNRAKSSEGTRSIHSISSNLLMYPPPRLEAFHHHIDALKKKNL